MSNVSTPKGSQNTTKRKRGRGTSSTEEYLSNDASVPPTGDTKDDGCIDIQVKTAYLADKSNPLEEQYVFAYTITIRNMGDQATKLLKRHWIITDAEGHVEEVRGDGVIGEQPNLQPGEVFEYTSGAILSTPVGCMQGSYLMLQENGKSFDAEIPAFGLAIPDILH